MPAGAVRRLDLFVLLFVSGSAALLAPAAAASDLVLTPCGMRPRECVREAPQHAVVRASGGDGFVVEHADGRLERVDVPDRCHAFMAEEHERLSRVREEAPGKGEEVEEEAGAIPNGWIESAGVYRMDPEVTIQSFTGKWTVPPAPTAPHKPETLYYFIGLEDRTQGKLTTIHQPVLTWGDQTEGGQFDNQWHLWSWTCCPKNLTWHSPDIAGFAPGETLFGRIEKQSADTWLIDGAWREKDGSWRNTTLVSQVGGFNYNYADVTLEVYNVTSCAQMSQGSVTFSELALTLSDRSEWKPPMWYVTGQPTNCDVNMKILNQTTMAISSN
jgi:hypothetical protein